MNRPQKRGQFFDKKRAAFLILNLISVCICRYKNSGGFQCTLTLFVDTISSVYTKKLFIGFGKKK